MEIECDLDGIESKVRGVESKKLFLPGHELGTDFRGLTAGSCLAKPALSKAE
jgi:hypothetical protein